MKKHDKNVQTFTKKWVGRLLPFFCICIAASYVLSYFERDPLEDLSKTVMTAGIAVFMGYMLKAFFETWSEENLKYKKAIVKLEKGGENIDSDTWEGAEDEGEE